MRVKGKGRGGGGPPAWPRETRLRPLLVQQGRPRDEGGRRRARERLRRRGRESRDEWRMRSGAGQPWEEKPCAAAAQRRFRSWVAVVRSRKGDNWPSFVAGVVVLAAGPGAAASTHGARRWRRGAAWEKRAAEALREGDAGVCRGETAAALAAVGSSLTCSVFYLP